MYNTFSTFICCEIAEILKSIVFLTKNDEWELLMKLNKKKTQDELYVFRLKMNRLRKRIVVILISFSKYKWQMHFILKSKYYTLSGISFLTLWLSKRQRTLINHLVISWELIHFCREKQYKLSELSEAF